MPLQSYRATINTGTGTGTVSLTGCPFPPKAIRTRWVGNTGSGDTLARGTADYGWGAACYPGATTGAADRAVCAHSTDAAGTTACQSQMRDDASIATVSGAGAAVGRAHVSSWDAGGVTFTIDAAFGANLEVEVWAYGGGAVDVAVGNIAAEPSATGTVDTTTVLFPSDCVQQFGISRVSGFSSPSQVQANSGIFFGVTTKNPAGTISNAVLATSGRNGQTTSNTKSYSRIGDSIARYDSTNTTTLDAFASISAILSNGFTHNWGRVNATGVTRIFFYLAIKGGNFDVLTLSQPTTTGTDITLTSNFKPQGASFFSVASAAQSTQGTAANSAQDNYGSAFRSLDATTSTSEGGMMVRDTNAQAGAITSLYANHTHCLAVIGNGTLTTEMHTTAWSQTSLTCRLTTADGTARVGWAFVWGPQADVSPPLAFPGIPGVGPPPTWVNRRPPYIAAPTTAAAGPTAYTATLSESVSLTESEASTFNAKATAITEAVSVTEANATVLRARAALTESASIAESVAMLFRATAALAETISTVESLAISRHTVQALSESASLSESLAARLHALASLAESCSTAESFASRWATMVGLAESASLAESIIAKLHAVTALAEVATLAESLASNYAARAALAESETLTEAVVVSRGTRQALSESVALSDAAAALYRAHPALSEAVTFLEAFSGPGSISVSESLALVETLAVHIRRFAALAETLTAAEAIGSKLAARTSLAEAVTAVESATTTQRQHASLSESVAVSEAAVALGRAIIALTETDALAESVVATGGNAPSSSPPTVTIDLSLPPHAARSSLMLAENVATSISGPSSRTRIGNG